MCHRSSPSLGIARVVRGSHWRAPPVASLHRVVSTSSRATLQHVVHRRDDLVDRDLSVAAGIATAAVHDRGGAEGDVYQCDHFADGDAAIDGAVTGAGRHLFDREHAARSAGVQATWRDRIDQQCQNVAVAQASVERPPALARVGALVDSIALRTRVDCCRHSRIDGKRTDAGGGGARMDAPGDTTVTALEHALTGTAGPRATSPWCYRTRRGVQRSGRNRVDD